MTYASEAALANDPAFADRLKACLCKEAQVKLGADPDDPLSQTILRTPETGTEWFMPFISTAPGFGEAYELAGSQYDVTDGMLLSAVQANWDTVAELHQPVPAG